MTKLQNLLKGLIKENPVFVLVLGTCPTLAISTSVTAAFGMGIAATAVLILSNMAISALRKVIPDRVRIPCYIVLIAGFVHEKPPKIFWKNPTVEAVPSSSAAPTALAASLTAAAASGASFVKNSTYAPSVGFEFSSVLSAASSAGAASAPDASASSFGASSLRFSAFT